MANRSVYGNTTSENGWPMVDEGSCSWRTVPGTNPPVTLEIQNGIPTPLLLAWAADFNAYVQPLRDADSACWTPTNSVATSNHLSGTAEDLDWDDHPMGNEYAGYSADQIATVRAMLAFYTYRGVQLIWWGNDWDTPHDSMHFQMGYDTYDNQDICNQFIAQFITPDGFSTFRRGAPAPAAPPVADPAPPADSDAAKILANATGLSIASATAILPNVCSGLVQSQCTNSNRIAMWLAQIGEESADFTATVEIGDIDGTTYQGRTWIQITGQANYAAFSQWAFNQGIVASPTYFVDNPAALGIAQWEAIGPAWYWTVARPQINSLCDNRDIVGVTEAINGGTNGLADRQTRYSRALAQGDALLELITTGDEDEMAGWTPDLVSRAMILLENQTGVFRPSLSPLHWPNEGNVDTDAGFAQRADASLHILLVEKLAVDYGDTENITLLWVVANSPDATNDPKLAANILSKVDEAHIQAAQTSINAWFAAEAAHKAA